MDTLHIEGLLRLYEFASDEEVAEYAAWWQRFSLAEKARAGRLVVEVHNLITSAGRSQILTFMGSASSPSAFAQYYAVGTGAIAQVQASDTALAGELFRAVPTAFTVVGNMVTVTTNFGATQAVGTYSNAGLWGNGATGTLSSGTLMTHLLYAYTKVNGIAIVNDYSLSAT